MGPRQTGKSTLLRHLFPEPLYVDLLEAETFRKLSTFPETLGQRVGETQRIVVIDEVQKLPQLLDAGSCRSYWMPEAAAVTG